MSENTNHELINNDEESLVSEITTARNSLTTDRLDMSFGEIMSMYENKEIVIRPDFQRLFRWTIIQQTKFIESILLGIPIPSIFVAEDKSGRWELVDGLQRISTVLSFFGILRQEDLGKGESITKNNWTLVEGDLVTALEGYNKDSLPTKYLLNIKRSSCRIEIIKWDSQWDMRYELFSRLNTGGSALTDQEIRNCIFRGGLKEFYDFIEEATENEIFKKLTALTTKQISELYLQELVVRFCSLVFDWENVDSSISLYMTSYMQKMQSEKRDLEQKTKDIFYKVLDLLKDFDPSIFRYPQSNVFSSTLYDGILMGLAHNIEKYEQKNAIILDKINILKSDNEFRQNSGPASNSKNRTTRRIRRAIGVFDNAN